MKFKFYKQCLVIVTIILLFGTTFGVSNVPSIRVNTEGEQVHITIRTPESFLLDIQDKYIPSQGNSDTEYWALLFAVGVYKNNPEQDRPSMLVAVEDLYNVLLDSPQWQEDHIHKITAIDATGIRLIQELNWLIQNVDNDDMVIVYLTTHGSCLLYTSPSPRDRQRSRMPSSA